jgi:hypothetical protein
MSATSSPALTQETPHGTQPRTGSQERSSTADRGARRKPQSPLAASVTVSVARSGKWSEWLAAEPRLAGFGSLEDALEGWRRRDERCYQVVAGLTALGSRRRGDDDDAALAVVVLLEEGIARVAMTLSDVCEPEDVNAAVWEVVKAAEPQMGSRAAEFLLKRARQRLTRPAAGMVARLETTSLEWWRHWEQESAGKGSCPGGNESDRDLLIAVPEVEDPVTDLVDLLTWAREVGVIAAEEIDLLVELLAADHAGMAREDAQRLAGECRGVGVRTIRRRRDATVARLREAAPKYLAAAA